MTDLNDSRVRDMAGRATRLLNGVGVKRGLMLFVTDPVGVAIHAQKPVQKSEMRYLPKGWLDLPPYDELGPCIFLDVDNPTLECVK